jgi:glycosyltransferase involved in cell wall biosynthesis
MAIYKSQTALVSIIINCYNGEKYLREAIDSIYAQTYENWEIIFWDNGSTDRSAEIAKSFDQRLRYCFTVDTTPLGAARNLALKKTKGKYIAFLDCDDIYLPEKLEKQVQLMEGSNYAMCYGSCITINEQGQVLKIKPVKNQSGYLFGSLLNHYEINMQTVMLRHSFLFEECLSFDINLKRCTDYDLFMEIASLCPVGVLDDILVKYRIVHYSLSQKTNDIASSELKFALDRIIIRKPDLALKYASEFDAAYKKLQYYDAIASLYRNDKKQARLFMRQIIRYKFEYLALYFMLFLPISSSSIIRLKSLL